MQYTHEDLEQCVGHNELFWVHDGTEYFVEVVMVDCRWMPDDIRIWDYQNDVEMFDPELLSSLKSDSDFWEKYDEQMASWNSVDHFDEY